MNKIKRFFRYLKWLEEQRIEAMVFCGRGW